MNYCSLKDAWGSNDHISKQFKEYMNPLPVETVEKNNHETFINVNNTKTNKKERICNNINCDDIIIHIKTCKKCYKKLKLHMKSNIMFNFVKNN